MNTNETQNDDQNEQNDQLTDLEPQDEVKGGGGARISKIIVVGVTQLEKESREGEQYRCAPPL